MPNPTPSYSGSARAGDAAARQSLAGEPPVHARSPAERVPSSSGHNRPRWASPSQGYGAHLPVRPRRAGAAADPAAGPQQRRAAGRHVLPRRGWVLGDAGTHDRLMREIAVEAGAALVFVDYDAPPRRDTRPPSSRPTRPPSTSSPTPRSGRRRDPPRGRRGRRRRHHGHRRRAVGQGAARPEDRPPGAVLPGDGRQVRHRLVRGLRRRSLAHPGGDAVVLGRLPAGRRTAAGGHGGAAQRVRSTSCATCPRPWSSSPRTTSCATRARPTPASCPTRACG